MKLVPIVVGVALVATMAACSSSSKSTSSSPGPSSSGGSGVAAPSGTPIKVGNIGSYSGPLASSLAGSEQTIKAWASSVNAAGGIDGHPVQLIVKDDGGNPTQSLAAAKSLVQDDHVVAIVADQSGSDQGFAAYVKAAGIPVVGGITISTTFLTNSDFFPSGSNTIALNYGGMTLAKKLGDKFGFIYCAEFPSCRDGVSILQALGGTVGTHLAYSASVSSTAADYTPICQGMKQAGVESYFVAGGSTTTLRIADACAQQGVTAKLIPLDGVLSSSWASDANLNGVVGAEIDFPFSDASAPASQAYQAALAKYAPKLGNLNGPSAAYSWVAGKLFEKAVEAGGTSAITSSSIIKGLYSLHDETLGGLAPPLNFTQGAPSLGVDCTFQIGIENGKFTSPNGLNASVCAPASVVMSVASKL